jgi:hypothetical protein
MGARLFIYIYICTHIHKGYIVHYYQFCAVFLCSVWNDGVSFVDHIVNQHCQKNQIHISIARCRVKTQSVTWQDVLTVVLLKTEVLFDVPLSMGKYFPVLQSSALPSKHQELLTQWHRVTLQKTRILTWSVIRVFSLKFERLNILLSAEWIFITPEMKWDVISHHANLNPLIQ